jgi:hypothetical protein
MNLNLNLEYFLKPLYFKKKKKKTTKKTRSAEGGWNNGSAWEKIAEKVNPVHQ